MKTRFLVFVSILAFVFLTCDPDNKDKDKKNKLTQAFAWLLSQEEPEVSNVRLSDNTHQLSKDVIEKNLLEVTETTMVFLDSDPTIQELKEGDIMLGDVTSKTPDSFLRMIEKMEKRSDGTVAFTTRQASIDEGFYSIRIKATREFEPSEVLNMQNKVIGLLRDVQDVELSEEEKKKQFLSASLKCEKPKLELPGDNKPIKASAEINCKLAATVDFVKLLLLNGMEKSSNDTSKLETSFIINPYLRFSLEFEVDNNTLKYLKFTSTQGIKLELSSTIALKLEKALGEKFLKIIGNIKVGEVQAGAFQIGPLFFRLLIPVYIGIEPEAEVGLKVSPSFNLPITEGIEYKGEFPPEVFIYFGKDGKKIQFAGNNGFLDLKMQAFGKGGATLSLFKALNFKVYEALGIEMGPKYFVKGEASINKSNLETCPIYKGELKGTLGAKGKARVSMDVFSKTLAEFTKDDFPIGELSLSISKPFELTLDNENCPPKDPPPSNCGGSVRSIGTRCY